jgi:hypothetical protein
MLDVNNQPAQERIDLGSYPLLREIVIDYSVSSAWQVNDFRFWLLADMEEGGADFRS